MTPLDDNAAVHLVPDHRQLSRIPAPEPVHPPSRNPDLYRWYSLHSINQRQGAPHAIGSTKSILWGHKRHPHTRTIPLHIIHISDIDKEAEKRPPRVNQEVSHISNKRRSALFAPRKPRSQHEDPLPYYSITRERSGNKIPLIIRGQI
jgi:hypothetical protein